MKPASNKAEAVLDALPYIDDTNYGEAHRQFALQLIQAECQTFKPKRNYLAHLPRSADGQAFLTDMIREQHQLIADKKVYIILSKQCVKWYFRKWRRSI